MIQNILWTVAIFLIVYTSIFLSVKEKFPQFKLITIFKSLKKKDNVQISPFKILMLTLAGKIGVGSIAGIALAIYVGGPGTIIWLWIFSFISAPISYFESICGIKYKEKKGNNYIGGPAYYLDKGLNKKSLARIYAYVLIITYIVVMLAIQSNTVAVTVNITTDINKFLIGIFLTFITFISILGDINKISNITSKLVPVMSLIYIFIGLFIFIQNADIIPEIFRKMLNEAFNIKTFGVSLMTTIIIGVQRGIFANEVGVGTTAIASSLSEDQNGKSQGNVQMLGTYFTSLVICTITAVIVLTTNYNSLQLNNINGIELVEYALSYHLGDFGGIILILMIFLFAFSTILASFCYGESNIVYLYKHPGIKIKLLKILILLVVLFGTIVKANILWNVVDILIAILTIINLYALIKLRRKRNDWK